MKQLDQFFGEKNDSPSLFLWQTIGPLFILCTFALAPNNIFLFLAGVVGLFLSARFQIKGFALSVLVLAMVALGQHFVLDNHHLWFFGVEGSYAFAFFITALNSEKHNLFVSSLFSQLQARSSSIANLEQEFISSREMATKKELERSLTIEGLQKELQEVQEQTSSLVVLNEVLRKSAASKAVDVEFLENDILDLQRKMEELSLEKGRLLNEISRFKHPEDVLTEHQKLIDALNEERKEKEQLLIVNMTLSRLHADENARAQTICSQVVSLEEENRELKKQVETNKSQVGELNAKIEELMSERGRYDTSVSGFEEMRNQYKFLQDRLRQAEGQMVARSEEGRVSLSSSSPYPSPREVVLTPEILHDYVPKVEVVSLHQRIQELLAVKHLYDQLIKQFGQQKEVLHKTRKQLFQADTELETLKRQLEMKEMGVDPIFNGLLSEMDLIDHELNLLRQENRDLQEIISRLIEGGVPSPSKKKQETPPAKKKKDLDVPGQGFLF